jgi:thiol-disulfide isomerase/thioredoxin
MKNIKYLLFYLFSTTVLFSQSKANFNLTIPLTNVVDVNDFGMYHKNEFIIQSQTRFPSPKKYMEVQEKTHKGIPVHDSISFYSLFSDPLKIKELYELGDISEDEYKERLNWYKVDSLDLKKIKKRESIEIIVGFYKNTQFIIADANHNKDFGDEVKYEFAMNFRDNPKDNEIRNLPVSKYTYEYLDKVIVRERTRFFVMYPQKKNPRKYNFSGKDQEYLSLLKFVDSWRGELNLNDKKYEFAFNGTENNYGIVHIRPMEFAERPIGDSFSSQFEYKIGDTVTLAKSKYKIDSLDVTLSKMYLSFLAHKKDIYGNAVGFNIKPFNFKTIENKELNFNEVFKKKKYTLLEFWGTWCVPCVMMTPKVKKLYNEYSSKLEIVGFSVEEVADATKKYVAKHQMPWTQSIISSYSNPILKELKITAYPTFILVDDNGKILSKGSVGTFDDMVNMIK